MHRLDHVEQLVELALDVVPGAEPREVLLLVALAQRVLAEQVAHLHDRGVDVLDRGVLADEEQIRVREHERSEEHTSELQSLMRISYAVFCLKKKKTQTDLG